MARRRRRHHRVRRYRHNPPRGIVGQVMHAALGGTGVVVGKVVGRQVTSMLRLDPSSATGAIGQLALSVGLGYVAHRFLRMRGPIVDGAIYGIAASGMESALKAIAPGTAGKLLGDEAVYEVPLSAYPSAAALPAAGASREQQYLMGAYATGIY